VRVLRFREYFRFVPPPLQRGRPSAFGGNTVFLLTPLCDVLFGVGFGGGDLILG